MHWLATSFSGIARVASKRWFEVGWFVAQAWTGALRLD